jgi:hypothetical protein
MPMHASRKHTPLLVLLDHGLYKELPTDFRLDYCRLWKVRGREGTDHVCFTVLGSVRSSHTWWCFVFCLDKPLDRFWSSGGG